MANHPERHKGCSRSATDWHTTVDKLGRTISYITSDEVGVPAIAVCSIRDPRSNVQSFRRVGDMDAAMGEADEPIPSHGLVVLGRHKHDRPSLDEVHAMTDINGAAAVDAVLAAQNAT